jgi:hypothetical protein
MSALAAVFVAVVACASMSLAVVRAQSMIPESSSERAQLPGIRCSADPPSIKPGETSMIAATAVSPQNRSLTYSYAASAGSISGSGASAVFSSDGAPAGRVTVICSVTDDLGRTASADAIVTITTPAISLAPYLIPEGSEEPKGAGKERTEIPPAPAEIPAEIEPSPAPMAPASSSSARRPSQVQRVLSSRTPAAASQAGEYAAGDELAAWKSGLKEGAIEYRVPAAMRAQQASMVTVKIHGYQDATGWQPMLGVTGTGALKVSSRMKVELLAPLNPAEFTITPQDNQAIKFVPNDGSATWMWSVTPAYKAKGQKLEIRVSLEYQQQGSSLEEDLEDTYYTVNVDVQGLSTVISHDFQKHPIEWLKYMLPGGSGWGALAALIASLGGWYAWWKKKTKKAARRTAVKKNP